MNDKMIQAQGGLYTPEELLERAASAYAERGDQIEELSRNNRRLEFRLAELEGIASAVTVLVNWVNKDKADNVWADLEDRIDSLETEQRELRSDLEDAQSDIQEAQSNIQEAQSDLEKAVGCIRDAAAELASI
jgi:predicted  nucleic acid-binding Zn-ribbon protein